MKISYFFNISVVIGRSDMKQKAKTVLRSMHSFPFIFGWILAYNFFFFFYFLIFHPGDLK